MKNMDKQILIEKLTKMCKQSEMFEDDICNNRLISLDEDRITTFFFMDDVLYCGERAGDMYYFPIGNVNYLEKIMYRLYEGESLEILFEFSNYKLALTLSYSEALIEIYEQEDYKKGKHYSSSDFLEIHKVLQKYLS